MSRLYYGKLTQTESGMPALEIIDEGGERKNPLYILPFRCYRFQVTTLNGEGDYGSSTIVGLGNLINIKPNQPEDTKGFSTFSSNISAESFGKEFMYGLALEAIIDYAKRYINIEYVVDLFGYKGKSVLREFIELCYTYVESMTSKYRYINN